LKRFVIGLEVGVMARDGRLDLGGRAAERDACRLATILLQYLGGTAFSLCQITLGRIGGGDEVPEWDECVLLRRGGCAERVAVGAEKRCSESEMDPIQGIVHQVDRDSFWMTTGD
jgi:hypothetical protein